MPDTINLRLEIGSWTDEAEGRPLRPLMDALTYADYELEAEAFVSHVLSGVRAADLNPWAHEFKIRSIYAGASAEHWTLVVDIAPYAGIILSNEALQIIGSGILGAIFGKLLNIPGWRKPQISQITLMEASERVREYMVQRDNVAPTQVKEKSGEKLEDRTYRFTVRRETDGHEFLFRLDEAGGVIARIDLTELDTFLSRAKSKGEESERR